jgi:hypothetical protein
MRRPRPDAVVRAMIVMTTVLAISPGSAAASGPGSRATRHPLLGAVPIRATALGARRVVASGPLVYHGGPVMRTNKTFAIYWVPSGRSMVSGYRSTINRYLRDVAADSGGTRNVYSTLTQYSDTTGGIAYSQTFGGSTTATRPFPSNGCPAYGGMNVCLTDGQVAAEVKRVIAAKGWVAGPTHSFFIFLPKNVGTCDDPAGTACAFISYCAYHSWTGTGATQIVYANMPYSDTDPESCSTGQRPNDTEADDTLNVTSHEHREMIEDPNGDAWYDSAGNEGADKCAWNFGRRLGSTATGDYNQTINGHHYYVQQEWTNAHSTCVQRGI